MTTVRFYYGLGIMPTVRTMTALYEPYELFCINIIASTHPQFSQDDDEGRQRGPKPR
jgi:hypothetical protein